jgi:hypothetical protein
MRSGDARPQLSVLRGDAAGAVVSACPHSRDERCLFCSDSNLRAMKNAYAPVVDAVWAAMPEWERVALVAELVCPDEWIAWERSG